MKTVDINKEGLNYLQLKAVENAVRENNALGLSYRIVEGGELVEVFANGKKRKLGKPKYGIVKVICKEFRLKK